MKRSKNNIYWSGDYHQNEFNREQRGQTGEQVKYAGYSNNYKEIEPPVLARQQINPMLKMSSPVYPSPQTRPNVQIMDSQQNVIPATPPIFHYDIPVLDKGSKDKKNEKEHIDPYMGVQVGTTVNTMQTMYPEYKYMYHPEKMFGSYTPPNNEKPVLLDFFGIFPEVPTINILKFFSALVLILLVELNILFNVSSERFAIDLQPDSAGILFGISLIGLLIGILFRYIMFEYRTYQWIKNNQQPTSQKNLLVMVVLILLLFLILFEVIVELAFNRGLFFVIDLLSISCVFFGIYTLFSGNRKIGVISFFILFLIMITGSSYRLDLPSMVLLGALTILYLELLDGACRLQKYVINYRALIAETDKSTLSWVYSHINRFSIQFIKNLGLFLTLTIVISVLSLSVLWIYPYITPAFIGENLELHSVYAVIPILGLLLIIFLIGHFVYPMIKTTLNRAKTIK